MGQVKAKHLYLLNEMIQLTAGKAAVFQAFLDKLQVGQKFFRVGIGVVHRGRGGQTSGVGQVAIALPR